MTELEKIAQCQVMIDDSNVSEDIVKSYLAIAGDVILNRAYPYDDTVTEVPRRYGYKQCEIAVFLLNKRGAEGEVSHSENGISRTYESADVPESMLRDIIPHCGKVI